MSREETLKKLSLFKQRIDRLSDFDLAFLFGITEELAQTSDPYFETEFGQVGKRLFQKLAFQGDQPCES